MLSLILRLAKRAGILLIGLLVLWLAKDEIFPELNDRLPVFPALAITYIIVAYGVFPLIVRIIRLIIRPKHIPLYCTTPDGFASDPINIGLIGTKKQLVSAMEAAGWHVADPRTPRNIIRAIFAFLTDREYNTAPFSVLYLFGRKFDIGFQKPLKDGAFGRHHVRFWACYSLSKDDVHHQHVRFWQRRTAISIDSILWLGAASRDIGLGLILHNAQVTHSVHPDTNAERELIIEDLDKAHRLQSTRSITAGKPYTVRNRSLGVEVVADGDIKLGDLREESAASSNTNDR